MPNYPGSIDRHGNQWRIRLSVGGKRHRFMLDGDMLQQDVEQLACEKKAELGRRKRRGLPGPMWFSELLARFREVRLPDRAPRTQGDLSGVARCVFDFLRRAGGDPKAHEIRPGHVTDFLHWRRTRSTDGATRAKPMKARSLAKDRAVLHAVFSFAETLEVVPGNGVKAVKPPKGDTREPLILDGDQYEKLLHACTGHPMLYVYVLLLGETGVRCNSEALWLRWAGPRLRAGLPHGGKRAEGPENEEREVAEGADDPEATGGASGTMRRGTGSPPTGGSGASGCSITRRRGAMPGPGSGSVGSTGRSPGP